MSKKRNIDTTKYSIKTNSTGKYQVVQTKSDGEVVTSRPYKSYTSALMQYDTLVWSGDSSHG